MLEVSEFLKKFLFIIGPLLIWPIAKLLLPPKKRNVSIFQKINISYAIIAVGGYLFVSLMYYSDSEEWGYAVLFVSMVSILFYALSLLLLALLVFLGNSDNK